MEHYMGEVPLFIRKGFKMNQKSKIILWVINLLACADSGILYNLAGQGHFRLLLVYRIGMPLLWGMLWVAFSRTSRGNSWNKETRKQARTMMLSMLALNVFSFSVSLSRWGNLAIYSLILSGLYLGKIAERKMKG